LSQIFAGCRRFSPGGERINGQQNVESSGNGQAKREVKKPWHKGREPVYMTGR
jgi:hypothetical protein